VAAALALTVAAGASLGACSTFDDTVATANGQKLSRDELETLLRQTGVKGDSSTSVAGGGTRTAITNWIRRVVTDEIPADSPGIQPDQLEGLYSTPVSTGFFCLRVIAANNRIEARDVVRSLASGTDFATVANQKEPTSNGGIVSGDTGECASITSLGLTDAGRLPAPVAQALVTLKPGVASEAITVNQDGWPPFVFLLHRPYAEIKDHLATAVAQDPVSAAKLGHLASARVSVASVFGRWDPISSSVLPQG
jgi:hypothetical protein